MPYSLPGLGTGLLFVGNFGNISDSTTDLNLIGGIGDAEFIFTFLDELFIAPELLYLQYLRAHGFKFALQQYPPIHVPERLPRLCDQLGPS